MVESSSLMRERNPDELEIYGQALESGPTELRFLAASKL